MTRIHIVMSLALAATIHSASAQVRQPSAAPSSAAAVASNPQVAFGVLTGRWVRPDEAT